MVNDVFQVVVQVVVVACVVFHVVVVDWLVLHVVTVLSDVVRLVVSDVVVL